MKLLKWIISWLRSSENPRWVLIGGAVILLILQTLVQRHFDNQTSYNIRISERTTELRLLAVDLQAFAGNYVTAVLDENPNTFEKRQALSEIISRQHTAVMLAENLFHPETANAADIYKDALIELRNLLPHIQGVLDMAPFWEANVKVLETRKMFLTHLEAQRS